MKVEDLDSESIDEFQSLIIGWGNDHYQNFSWRNANSSYEFLIAEIMLHRTQAVQVEPIYKKFIRKYPDFHTLSNASDQDIFNSLYSLGLHWRIEKLITMIEEINEQFNGIIPQEKESLMSLSGVSDYISSALRCFYFGKAEALIDTNTTRIIGRVFGLEIKDSSRRNKSFINLLNILLSNNNPATYNYALLDLAHLRCYPKMPLCEKCPLLKFPCKFSEH
jgi:A/G-specific adenine glycosylase